MTYQWDGQAWVNTGLLATANMIERFYTAASATWTYLAGLAYLEVEGQAPGGGGAGAALTGATTWSLGAGGGGGAWGMRLFDASELPASVTITNGAPGGVSAGPGIAGGNSTFGSIITLPGGAAGVQGGNTTGAGSALTGPTAAPTGVTVGVAGEGSDYTLVNTAGINLMGRSGGSRYGRGSPLLIAGATGAIGGIGAQGWGSGGSGAVNPNSQSARNSAAGNAGFWRVREFYTQVGGQQVAARSTFAPIGSAGVNITVPTGAKLAKIRGTIYMAAGPTAAVYLRLSADGTTFIAGATDYAVAGINNYGGTTTPSPAKQAQTNTNAFQLTPGTDSTIVPQMFECDLITQKGNAAQLWGHRSRGWSYNSAATNLMQDYIWEGYTGHAGLTALTQLPAFQIVPSGGTWAAGSLITIDWVY